MAPSRDPAAPGSEPEPGPSPGEPPDSPWVTGGRGPTSEAVAGVRRAAWPPGWGRKVTDQLTLVLLVAGAAAVIAAAAPSVVRGCAAPAVAGAREGIAATMRGRGYLGVGVVGPGASRTGDLAGRLGAARSPAAELERGTRAALEDDERAGALGGDGPEPATWGIAAVDVVLRSQPEPAAEVVAQVERGQLVVIARRQQAWLFVGHRGEAGLQLGWLPAEQVLVPR